MESKLEQVNAKITGTTLGFEYHGIMSFWIYLEFKSGGIGFGGYSLDQYDKDTEKRVGISCGLDMIRDILETVGVEKWEDLKGKYVVLESEGWGGKATGIGNLIDDTKWFRPKEWFAKRRY